MGDLSVPAKSHRSRWLAAGLAIAAVAVVSGSTAATKYFHADQAAAGPAAPEQAVAVTVAVVKPRQTSLWDEFSGRLEAVDRVDVRSRVAGAVQATSSPKARWSSPATCWSPSIRRPTRPRSSAPRPSWRGREARADYTQASSSARGACGTSTHRPARARRARQRLSRGRRQPERRRGRTADRAAEPRLHGGARAGCRAASAGSR